MTAEPGEEPGPVPKLIRDLIRSRRQDLLLGAALVALFCAYVAWINSGFIIDDSFILYRYGRNIARGDGPCFNPGEYVEGFTTFAWTYLLAFLAWLGFDLVRAGPVVGTLFGLGCLVFTWHIALRVLGKPKLAWLATALAAFSGPLAFWAAQGLETPMFACAVLGGVHFDLREREDRARERPLAWSALCFGVAAITRPEGAFAFALAGALRGWEAWRGERTWVSLPRYAAPFLALLIPLLVWRLATFGEWVPNTYYTKAHDSPLANAARGVKYLGGVYRDWGGGRLLPVAVAAWGGFLLLFVAPVGQALSRNAPHRRVALYVGLYTGAICFEGGDWMPYARFFVPILPLMFVLVVSACGHPRLPTRAHRPVLVIAMLWLALTCTLSVVWKRNGPSGTIRDGKGLVHAHQTIGKWLAEHAREGESVAVGDIGYIGYYSDLHLVDILGLIDADLSRMPGIFPHKVIDIDATLDQRPAFVVVIQEFPEQRKLVESRRFQAEYQLTFRRNARKYFKEPAATNYWLFVFQRKDRETIAPPPSD